MVAIALGLTGVSAAAGQSLGPMAPASVVNDSSFGVAPWLSPEEAAHSDDVDAIVFNVFDPTYYLKATDFGFTIPNGAVIEGIEVAVEKTGFESFDAAVRIVKGGTISTTDKSMVGLWPFDLNSDTVVTYGGSNDLWGELWTPADINAAGFGFAISAGGLLGVPTVDAISITVFYGGLCGNDVIDLHEQCDDGNTADGDCCSSACQFDLSGTPCYDATVCNGAETCDGTGGCDPGTPLDCDDASLCTQDFCHPVNGCANEGSPVAGCRTAARSILIMKNKSPDTKDKLVWKWIKGEPTDQADFGVPTGTTATSLCIYTGTADALAADYHVPGDAMKWAPTGPKGYKYKDRAGTEDGITKVILKGSTLNQSKCLVKGKGDGLDAVDLENLDDSGEVIVQLVNDSTSACFESTFDTDDFITFDDPAQFKAKAQ